MKNNLLVKKYASVLETLSHERLGDFKKFLENKGHQGLLKKIYKEFLRRNTLSVKKAVVFYAREKDLPLAKKFIENVNEFIFDEVSYVQKRNLIGGFKVLCQGKFIDKSYKNRLLDLYHKII